MAIPSRRLRVLLALCFFVLSCATGCARRGAVPEEFPPVRLGMARAATRDTLAAAGARILADSPRMLRAVGRDRRVAQEVFLFYDGRLAAWTLRFAEPASRASFGRASRRLARCFGEPADRRDDGLVLTARWRTPGAGGRVLLSGYVGGRSSDAPLMVRVEDPSVVRSLIRQMDREGDSAASR